MRVSRNLVAAILLATVAIAAACSGKLPKLAPPANCGDQCAAMSCPPGSSCTLTGNCNPRCEQQPLPLR